MAVTNLHLFATWVVLTLAERYRGCKMLPKLPSVTGGSEMLSQIELTCCHLINVLLLTDTVNCCWLPKIAGGCRMMLLYRNPTLALPVSSKPKHNSISITA